MVLAAWGCAHAADGQPDRAVIDADNAFGLKLLVALPSGADGNKVISPLSIAMALQIIYNGAKGPTRQAMAAALQLNALEADAVNAANQALQTGLANPGGQNQIVIANSLWVRHGGRDIDPKFTQINQSFYAAHIGDLAGAPDNVNAWISGATQGRIPQLLAQRNYGDATAIVANAIYFKGRWSEPFSPDQTRPDLFRPESGSRAKCTMMNQLGHLPYFQTPDFAAVRLDYSWQRLGMVILLPNSGHSLVSVVARITADSVQRWRSLWQPTDVVLSLPRFKAAYQKALPAALKALGMELAFDPERGDFSGIAPNTYLSDVEHAALVQADEAGTTASAATSELLSKVCIPAKQPIAFKVDHPFFFAILDEATGALLFAGTVSNPGVD
jgi:serpin B